MQPTTKRTVSLYVFLSIVGAIGILLAHSLGMHRSDATYAFAPVLLVLLTVALIFDPFGLLCVLLAWLPFFKGFLQIQIGIVTFNPYALGMIMFALAAAVRVTVGRKRYGFTTTDAAIALLCLVFLVSTMFSDQLIRTGYLAFHALFIPVISYFALKAFVKSEQQYRQAVAFFVAGVAVFGLIAIIQFLSVHQRVSVLGIPFIGVATFTLSALLVIVYSGPPRSILKVGLAALLFVAFFVTFSRAYLLYLLVTPILFRLIRRGHAAKLILGLFIASLSLTLLVAYNADRFRPTHFNQATVNTSKRLTSVSDWKAAIYGRAIDYRAGLETFLEHPLFGVGIQRGEYMVTQHDFQVEWLEYGGIVGYLLYTAVFLLHFSRLGRRANDDRMSAVGLLAILVIMGNSVTNGFMHGIMPYMVFLLMGLNEARLHFLPESDLPPVPVTAGPLDGGQNGKLLRRRKAVVRAIEP